MTPEEIKSITAWATLHREFDGVVRLLDEREVLLNAAKGVHDLLGNEPHDPIEARNALAAAIAHAEEP